MNPKRAAPTASNINSTYSSGFSKPYSIRKDKEKSP